MFPTKSRLYSPQLLTRALQGEYELRLYRRRGSHETLPVRTPVGGFCTCSQQSVTKHVIVLCSQQVEGNCRPGRRERSGNRRHRFPRNRVRSASGGLSDHGHPGFPRQCGACGGSRHSPRGVRKPCNTPQALGNAATRGRRRRCCDSTRHLATATRVRRRDARCGDWRRTDGAQRLRGPRRRQ